MGHTKNQTGGKRKKGIVNTITSQQPIGDQSQLNELSGLTDTRQIRGLNRVMHFRTPRGEFKRVEEWTSEDAFHSAAQQSVPYQDQLKRLEMVVGTLENETGELIS